MAHHPAQHGRTERRARPASRDGGRCGGRWRAPPWLQGRPPPSSSRRLPPPTCPSGRRRRLQGERGAAAPLPCPLPRRARAPPPEEDDQGVTGINLSKELPAAAARALQENLLAFAPAVLPATELLRVAFSSLRRKFLGKAAKRYRSAFRRAFQHFCIHPGGSLGAERGAAGARPLRRRHGGVAHDAAPVRQHVRQLAAVRAGLHRGQGPDEEGRPGVHDRLQPRHRLQQRGVRVHQAGGAPRRRTLGRLHPPLPCPLESLTMEIGDWAIYIY
ncbi:hypothetical protein PVAP13_8KG277920 [Panicum virgatum]|uniref:FAE domain-containing protein n=1 Tax=Panicum virgatum TaxID=38727 RepID=A0A8T0PPH6_PANVG|nr:hypothetical protein PVAP13_8KG277920 [Panicum virgatum]